LAEGKISWAFWPPETPREALSSELNEAGLGIWIPQDKLLDAESDQESEDEGEDASKGASSEEEVDSDVVEEVDENNATTSVIGRFGALAVSDESDDDEIDDEGE
jgi:hypothetical protein